MKVILLVLMINSQTLDVVGTYFGPYQGYVECKLQAQEVLKLFKDTSKIKLMCIDKVES